MVDAKLPEHIEELKTIEVFITPTNIPSNTIRVFAAAKVLVVFLPIPRILTNIRQRDSPTRKLSLHALLNFPSPEGISVLIQMKVDGEYKGEQNHFQIVSRKPGNLGSQGDTLLFEGSLHAPYPELMRISISHPRGPLVYSSEWKLTGIPA